MIDESWLSDLRFESHNGMRIEGLLGVGTQKVVLKVVAPDGKELALATYKHHLGYHIKEIPPFLNKDKNYDLDRLNKKLANLIGFPMIDEMCQVYDRLHSWVLKFLHEKEHAMAALIMGTRTPESVETIPFLLQSPGTIRRLSDWATMTDKTEDPLENFIEVNGPNFPIKDLRQPFIKWANETLAGVQRVPQPNRDMKAEELNINPVYIWGAAVMDGFFKEEEFDIAAAFIEENFGRITESENLVTILAQADAMAHLVAQFVNESGEEVARFVKFCAKLGLVFQVHDRDGKLVADGFKYMF